MHRLKHFARYLAGIQGKLGMYFPKDGDYDVIECFSDSDWAGDQTDRKSISCGVFRCGDCTLSEFSRGQAIQALSSAEAEYYAAVSVAADGLHLQQVLDHMKIKTVVRIRMDSSAGKAIAQRLGVGRVRCLDVRTLWLQTKVRDKKLVVIKQAGESNLADIGTKSLAGPRFTLLRGMIGRVPLDLEARRATEEKASVGMVTAAGGKKVESSALAALAVLMSLIEQTNAKEECDYDYSGNLVRYETKVVATTGFDVGGKALMITMAVIFLLGLVCGMMLACRCMRAKAKEIKIVDMRTVQTQSMVRYNRELAQSRFQPLPEFAHGAWV